MATWQELGEEHLRAAKVLKDKRMLRGAINRAYYAAYAVATHTLNESGATVNIGERQNPSHAQIAQLVRHNLDPRRFTDQDRQNLSRRVRQLQRFRVMADYDPSSYIDSGIATDCVRDAVYVSDRLGRTVA